MQVHPDVTGNSPFLVIHEKKVKPFPLLPSEKEDPESEVPHASVEVEFEFSQEKWVHFGCEIILIAKMIAIDEKRDGQEREEGNGEGLDNGFGLDELALEAVESGVGD
ncbi:hypothetical protein L484_015717 [Morus notabilis]|uniref:Uncharacterized protein n=1 Tax=Morus notabilis TaxID=981085 RepID=W9SPM9_9ROSA|nr:hypothetical protein L484_015717 [Morus notabilis]